MNWPVGALIVINISGALWLLLLALEWFLAWRRRHHPRRVSDGLLRSYHREALREAAPQYVCWPSPAERAERGKR